MDTPASDRPKQHATAAPEARAAMTRRDAIRSVGLLLGGVALFGCRRSEDVEAAADKAAGTQPDSAVGGFSAPEVAYLDEIAETIIPATKTPGAKAAKVGAFMALMVSDCYDPEEQKTFREGMRRVDEAAKKAAGVPFLQASPEQRLAVLAAFDRRSHREAYEAEAEERERKGLERLPAYDAVEGGDAAMLDTDGPVTFFRMMKELTLLGYFTSEIGASQVLRYVPVPGRYDPCIDYAPGTPAWAT